jgi:hypothetical protein
MNSIADGAGTSDGSSGPVEGDEEAVTCGVDRFAMEPCQLPADEGVMAVDQIPPA